VEEEEVLFCSSAISVKGNNKKKRKIRKARIEDRLRKKMEKEKRLKQEKQSYVAKLFN